MNLRFKLAVVSLLLVVAVSPIRAADATQQRPPNIIFILADDLGYGDVGIFYQNARHSADKPAFATPNLDALAKSGIMLRQHYSACPVCAPARASLMTGESQGHCPIRDNQFDKPLPPDILTLAAMLKQANYHTIAVGKWGLGGKEGSGWPAHPMKVGFDDFFGFMMHKYGHVYYHDKQHPLMDGLTEIGAKYENVYSTDLFTARAKKYITDHEAQHPDQPFFMYLAYTAVHNALNVPGEAYPAGRGKSGGMQWPLKPTPETRNKWIYPEYAKQPWTNNMKRYATMARRLDDGVGDVLQLLTDLHIADNTLVIFSSDNGPANEGGADPRLFDSWGPFDGFKRDCFEGGVREPTIVSWPGHVPAGRTSDFVSVHYDWMPTLAEVAHLAPPAQSDGLSLLPTLLGTGKQKAHPFIYCEYDMRDNWKQPALEDVRARKGKVRGQQQLVRIGDYVGVRTQIKQPGDPIRLYDVVTDPHEDHPLPDVASKQDLFREMTDLLVSARRPLDDAPRPYDDVPLPAAHVEDVKSGHVMAATYDGNWPWTPDFTVLSPVSSAEATTIGLPDSPPDHPFGLQFTGYLSVPKTGVYTFTATADAGVHLWLNESHVIDADHCTPSKPITETVRLSAGRHPIRVAYIHRTGQPVFTLHYKDPDGVEQAIPPSALSVAER